MDPLSLFPCFLPKKTHSDRDRSCPLQRMGFASATKSPCSLVPPSMPFPPHLYPLNYFTLSSYFSLYSSTTYSLDFFSISNSITHLHSYLYQSTNLIVPGELFCSVQPTRGYVPAYYPGLNCPLDPDSWSLAQYPQNFTFLTPATNISWLFTENSVLYYIAKRLLYWTCLYNSPRP